MSKFNLREFFKPTQFKIFAFLIVSLFRILWVYEKGILDVFTLVFTLIFSYIIAVAADMIFRGLISKDGKNEVKKI